MADFPTPQSLIWLRTNGGWHLNEHPKVVREQLEKAQADGLMFVTVEAITYEGELLESEIVVSEVTAIVAITGSQYQREAKRYFEAQAAAASTEEMHEALMKMAQAVGGAAED